MSKVYYNYTKQQEATCGIIFRHLDTLFLHVSCWHTYRLLFNLLTMHYVRFTKLWLYILLTSLPSCSHVQVKFSHARFRYV